MQVSTDAKIRELLIPFVHHEHEAAPDTLYIEEFALYGGCIRCDLAALNGVSHGYEIKSDKDTLSRLPNQIAAYNDVFQRATLVCGDKYLENASREIPAWWGVVHARQAQSELALERIREARPNPCPSAYAIAALLWRTEALRLLSSLGLDNGVRSKPMRYLIDRLAAEIEPNLLSNYVRQAIRARGDWRLASRLARCGGMSQQLSSRWNYPRNPYVRTRR